MPTTPLPLIPWSKTRLLSARRSLESSVVVQRTALDLFVLGYPEYANKLIKELYEHGHGIEFDVRNGLDAIKALYDAWDETRTLPSYVKNPEPGAIINGRNADGEWSVSWFEKADEHWIKGLPEEIQEKAKSGGLDAENLKAVTEQLKSGQKMTVAAVVQVAILTGEEGVAEDLVNDNVRNLFEHIQEKWDDSDTEVSELRKWLDARLGLQYSPKIWKVLKNAALGKALQVDTKALEAFVDEGCDMIKERFTQGPARPYADHSFAELVQILDESYIAARKANPTAGEHMSVLALDNWPNEPTSFLRPPATEGQITELEARLSRDSAPDDDTKSPMLPDKHLPEDYKDFLRTSNGFETDANDQCGIFYGVEYVGTTDVLFFHDMDFTLFPYEYTSVSGTDNVSLGKFRCFSIGAGGDEGEVILIPPSSVKPVLEAFEVVYAKASEQNKRMYDRAAVDLYGGLEALRNLEWLCIVWYHWNPDQEVWGSFRKCLEECVSYAVERRRTDERDARAAELEKEKGNGGNEAGEKRKRNAKTDQKAQTAEASDVDMGDSGDGAKTYDLRERKSRRTD